MKRLPLVLWIVAVGSIVPATALNAWLDWGATVDLIADAGFMLLVVGAATTGAVVASRVPGNAIGWTLLALGAGLGVGMLAGSYAEASPRRSVGPLPADEWMAWLGNWLPLVVLFGATAALLMLFPDGRLVSRGWRPVAWIMGAGVVLAGVAAALDPDPLGEAELPNPLGPEGAGADFVRDLITVTDLLALPLLLAAAASLTVRFRRSRGVERLQLKWFTFDAAIVGVALGLSGSVGGVVADTAFVVGLLALAALPVTAGVAVLRYRLYDIDVVIRRTLDLRGADRHARRDLLGDGAARRPRGREVRLRRRRLHARGGGPLPAGVDPHPGACRPPLLSPPLRRGAHAGGVRRPVARRGRPGNADGRSPRRRERDRPARPRVGVAAMKRRLPWILWGVSVGLSLATVVLMLLAGGRAAGTEGSLAFDAVLALGLLTFPTVGL